MTWDADMYAIINRHEFLCRNVPRCEFCGADQVQLLLKSMPAEWKCRVCKRHFKHEPSHALAQHADETGD